MSLLNALLPIAEETPITHVEYLSPEMVPEIVGKKDSIVDVRCRDSAGRQFIVEMQMHWNEDFMKRVLLNASKSIVKQAGMGEKYRQIQPDEVYQELANGVDPRHIYIIYVGTKELDTIYNMKNGDLKRAIDGSIAGTYANLFIVEEPIDNNIASE